MSYPSGIPGLVRHVSVDRVACTMLRMGAVGMVVGTMVAGADNARKARAGEISRETAVRDTLLGGAKTGVAAGVGTGLASLLGHVPVLPLATMVLTGTAIMYGLNAGRDAETPPADRRKA